MATPCILLTENKEIIQVAHEEWRGVEKRGNTLKSLINMNAQQQKG